MAEKKKYNSILVSGRKDETLTYSKFVKDEESGESVKESLDKKVNVTDELTTQQIKDGAITNEKMAADSVGSTNLQDGSVSNEKLEDGSITNEKLAENSITKDKLKDNTIGVEKLDPELRQTINAATGLPENLVETIQNVDDTLKDHQRQLDDKQSQIDDKQQQITANDEDISLLQTRSTQMEETIKSIAATGGASQATAVTYNNEKSKLTAVNIQSAVDEVVDKVSIKDESGENQDTPFRVISNDEFIMAVVDSENRLLFGIYRDTGKPYYPQNDMYHISQSEEFLWIILDAANHPLLGIQKDGTCWAAKAQWLDDIKAIKEALKTFQSKEDGKGLINLDVADSFFYISNDEYIIAVVDREDRILAGIKYDAQPYFPNHEMYSVITNEEWLYTIIDAENKVLGGFRADDGHMIVGGIDISTFIANAIIDIACIKERTAHLSTIVNDEYLSVETDSEGKVIGYIAPDGSHYLYKVKSETIPTEFEYIEDPEGRTEITTDADGKVLGYRDNNGIRHEEEANIGKLQTSKDTIMKLAKVLNKDGSFCRFSDLSEMSSIKIDMPTCAKVNIYTISGIETVPNSKTSNKKCFMQFFDGCGIYFNKKVIVNAQGNSSLGDPKKNLAIDICNDDWIGEDTCSVRFGDWVPQDSFHLKAYYYDTFVGIPTIGYKLYDEIVKTRGIQDDRTWKRALIPNAGLLPSVLENEAISRRIDTGARCFPDGFPCILYFEGEFYGIFSWQLKKHRDNFAMDKKEANHIHLDGAISPSSFFLANGNIDWDIWNYKKNDANNLRDGIEIRNPKSLICIDGSKYDFDSNAKELIGDDSELYDSQNKDMVRSAKVKKALVRASKYIPEILQFITDGKSIEEIKSKIEEYFDVKSIIDYSIFTDITLNVDGLLKNWQWTTYDGIKWSVNPYDLDQTFGLKMSEEAEPWIGHRSTSTNDPYGLVCKYYNKEITERYAELRDKGVLNTNHIVNMLNNWSLGVGLENYKLEQEKWTAKRKDNIYRFANWVEKAISGYDTFFNYKK